MIDNKNTKKSLRPDWHKRAIRGLFQRGPDWWIEYYVKGRRRREKISPNKKLALTVLAKRKVEIAEGKFLDKEGFTKLTFKEFAEKYMEEWSKPFKASWESQDKWRLAKLVPHFGQMKLHEIEPKRVQDYMRQRLQEVSPRTVNMELGLLKAMLNKAVEWGDVSSNPIMQVKKVKQHRGRLADASRVRYLEKDEFARLLEHCDERLRAIVLLAVNTGLRKGEIQNLSLNDVDFKKRILTIEKQKSQEVSRLPLNKTANEVLLETKRNSTSELPFHYNFRKAFETAVKRGGIKNFRFHDLRHTFASWLAMAGTPIYTVKKLMRHKDIKMTERYAHLSPNHEMEAVKVLDTFKGFQTDTRTDTRRSVGQSQFRNSL